MKYKITILIIICILFLILLKTKEEYYNKNNNKIKIGLIIPTTSNKRNYKNIKEIDFFKILINSFKKIINNNYVYNFYLGYDDDDIFYNKNKNDIINYFYNLKLKNTSIKLIKIKNKKGKVGSIWSDLADIALNDECEYLYQIGDDIKFITPHWEKLFINKLRKQHNIGVVGPKDINNNNILTQSFVHKTHLKIFKRYFPEELKNWYIDDWITNVYTPNYSYKFEHIHIQNTGGNARYDIVNDKQLYLKILEKDKKIVDKRTIRNDKLKRIHFKDFWRSFSQTNNYFTKLLTKYGYEFEIVDTAPDIIIFSVFGMYHKSVSYSTKNIKDKNIKKCFFTGENKSYAKKSIIKGADLNLTFQNTSKYNNIRLPLWILYSYDKKMQLVKKKSEGFCCFVYSNNINHRNAFCRQLSNYKKVDCGGGSLNNVGGKVKNKIEFQKKYKFCIAYENSVQPGYTTEKILEAYKSNCIPIYYGSETIKDDFNPKTFINAHDFDNNNDLINYIKKVDTDVSLYNSYMNKPIFSKKWLYIFNDTEETYFKNIAQKIME